jgi:hypothetical protein
MKKIYYVDGVKYEIPLDKSDAFIKDFPTAKVYYKVGDEEYQIPHDKADAFEMDMGLKKKVGGESSANTSQNVGVSASPLPSQSDEELRKVDLGATPPEFNTVDGNAPADDSDPFANVKYVNELNAKTKTVAGRTLPDEEAKAYGQSILNNLKDKHGFDEGFLNVISDVPEEWYNTPGFTKPELLQRYKQSPANTERYIAALKWQQPVINALEKEKEENPNLDITPLVNTVRNSASDVNYSDKRVDNKAIVELANKIPDDDEREKALHNLAIDRQYTYGQQANSPDAIQNKNPNFNQYQAAAFDYYKDIHPHEAKQFDLAAIDPALIKDNPDAQVGLQEQQQKLEQVGINLAINHAKENIQTLTPRYNELEQKMKAGIITPEEMAEGEDIGNKIIKSNEDIQKANEAYNKFNEKYPTLAEFNNREFAQELLGQEHDLGHPFMTVGNSIENTGNGVVNFVKEPFQSDQNNQITQLEILGKKKMQDNTAYLTQDNQLEKTFKPQIDEDLKAQIDAIKSNKDLSFAQKLNQVKVLLDKNPGKFSRTPIEGGKSNIGLTSMLYGVGDLAANLAPFMALEAATGGGATAGAARKFASAFAATAATSYQESLANAIEKGEENPYAYAFRNTAINSLAMASAGTPDAIRALASTQKGAIKDIISKLSDSEIEAALKESSKTFTTFKKLYGVGKNIVKGGVEGLTSGAKVNAFTTAGQVANDAIGGELKAPEDYAKQAMLETLKFGAFGAMLGGAKKISRPSETTAAAIIEAGTNPEPFINALDQRVHNGTISPKDAEQIKLNIEKAQKVIKANPQINNLKDDAKREFVLNAITQLDAKEQAKSATPSQALGLEKTELVAKHKNALILEPQTDKQLETQKAKLEKQLIPEKDADGKIIPIEDKVKLQTEAELEAIKDVQDERARNKSKGETTTEPIQSDESKPEGQSTSKEAIPESTNGVGQGNAKGTAPIRVGLSREGNDVFISTFTHDGSADKDFKKKVELTPDEKKRLAQIDADYELDGNSAELVNQRTQLTNDIIERHGLSDKVSAGEPTTASDNKGAVVSNRATPVNYEDATKISHTVSLENLPNGVDEQSREARSQIIRERENTPPTFEKHPIGTYAVDKYGEVHQLQELPIKDVITKSEGTQRTETVDKYAKWQKETGEILPVKGVENFAEHKGKVVITDGQHRVLAAKENGNETIPVWVALTDPNNHARPLYEKDILRHIENKLSDKGAVDTDIERAKEIVNSGEVKGYSAAPLIEAAKNDPEQFQKYLKNIAEQAHDEGSRESTIKTYGKELTEIAQRMFPEENTKSNLPKSTTESSEPIKGTETSGSGTGEEPPTKEAEPTTGDEEWTSIRKQKLADIEGAKELFEKREKKSWSNTYQSAAENVQKMYPKKSLYEALKARVDFLAKQVDEKILYNPTSEDIAVLNMFRAETQERIKNIEGLESDNVIERQAALAELDGLKSDLFNIARSVNPEGEAGRAFNMHQSEIRNDPENGLKIRRMELMNAKGGEKLTPEEEKWVNDKWEQEKDLLNKEHEAKVSSMQEDFDNRISELQKEYEEKLKKAKSSTPSKTEKSLSQKGKDVADKIRKLKKPVGSTNIDFTLGTWDLAVEGIAQLVEKGSTVAEAIEKMVKDGKLAFKADKDREDFESHIASALGEKSKEEYLADIKDFADKNSIGDIGGVDKADLFKEAFNDLKKILPNATKESLVEAYLKEGDFKPETKAKIENSIKEQQAELKRIAKAELTADQEQKIKLAREKVNAEKKIKEFTKKLAEGNFEDKPPVKLKKQDAELIRIKKQQSIIEEQYRKKQKEFEENKKSGIERAADFIRSAYVAVLIGAPSTLAKVASMSVMRPLSEAATKATFGKIFDKFFPGISKVALKGGESSSLRSRKAGVEAYFRQMGEKKIERLYETANKEYNEAATAFNNYSKRADKDPKQLKKLKDNVNDKLMKVQGTFIYKFIGGSSIKDALKALVYRHNEIEKQFGHVEGESIKDGNWLDKVNYVLGFIGRSHSAAKTFSGRFSYAAGFMARLEGAVKAGEDISNPERILEIAHESYIDWERGKYQQSNQVSDLWNKMVNNLPEGEKGTEKENMAKAMQTILKTDVAITRVPVNILHEQLVEYTFGVFKALAMAAKNSREIKKQLAAGGYTKGEKTLDGITSGTTKEEFKAALKEKISQMDEKQAATIARCFRKGGMGAGLYALTLILGGIHFGIFPHMGQKKKKDEQDLEPGELNPGDIVVGDKKLPHSIAPIIEHIPALWTTFMGLGMAQEYKDQIDKGKTTKEAAMKSIYTHLKVIEGGIPQTKIFSPTETAKNVYKAVEKKATDAGVVEKDTGKPLTLKDPNTSTKRNATKEEMAKYEEAKSRITREKIKDIKGDTEISLDQYGDVTTSEDNASGETKLYKNLTPLEKDKYKKSLAAKAANEAKKEVFPEME